MKLTKDILKQYILDELKEGKWRWAKFNCHLESRTEEQEIKKMKGGEEKPISKTTTVRICDLKKVDARN